MMKIKLFITATDGQDGSFGISFHNSKKEALDYLDTNEEELKTGCFYEDGAFREVKLEFDDKGKLINNPYLCFGD